MFGAIDIFLDFKCTSHFKLYCTHIRIPKTEACLIAKLLTHFMCVKSLYVLIIVTFLI